MGACIAKEKQQRKDDNQKTDFPQKMSTVKIPQPQSPTSPPVPVDISKLSPKAQALIKYYYSITKNNMKSQYVLLLLENQPLQQNSQDLEKTIKKEYETNRESISSIISELQKTIPYHQDDDKPIQKQQIINHFVEYRESCEKIEDQKQDENEIKRSTICNSQLSAIKQSDESCCLSSLHSTKQ